MHDHRRRKPTPPYEEIVTAFVKGCGLRQRELERLRVRDFYQKKRAFVYEVQWIHVDADHDLPAHEVPVFESEEWTIPLLCQGRAQDDLVFRILPPLDYAALREEYASMLFMVRYEGIGTTQGAGSVHEVGQQVKQALGLPRLDATRRAWMRRARRKWKEQSVW